MRECNRRHQSINRVYQRFTLTTERLLTVGLLTLFLAIP